MNYETERSLRLDGALKVALKVAPKVAPKGGASYEDPDFDPDEDPDSDGYGEEVQMQMGYAEVLGGSTTVKSEEGKTSYDFGDEISLEELNEYELSWPRFLSEVREQIDQAEEVIAYLQEMLREIDLRMQENHVIKCYIKDGVPGFKATPKPPLGFMTKDM